MLSDNIWFTRKSRIRGNERLRSNDFHSQLILMIYSASTVSASVYFLAINPQSQIAPVLITIFSIMILSISIFITSRNFKGRAMLMKNCYEELDQLYREADKIEKINDEKQLSEISMEYQYIVRLSENHQETDYFSAIVILSLSGEEISKNVTKYHYFRHYSYLVRRGAYLTFFYFLPVIIYIIVSKL